MSVNEVEHEAVNHALTLDTAFGLGYGYDWFTLSLLFTINWNVDSEYVGSESKGPEPFSILGGGMEVLVGVRF